MTLRLFDSQETDNNELKHLSAASSRKSSIVHLNNNRQLTLVYKLLSKLH